ncbi:MAG: hypothetical protein GY851_03305 [bacterium]|nr:hypothetical protein [bacterium]
MIERPELLRQALAGLRFQLNEVRVPADAKRRDGCERDLLRFIKTYFPYLRAMNRFQSAFATEIQGLIIDGAPLKQLKALAAPRGGGKSTICQLALLWAAMYGHVRFALILAANGDKAKERVGSIQEYVLRNELLNEDFPEICGAVRDFRGDPRRAPPQYPWSTLEMRLANGTWIMAAGIDGAIAGALKGDDRPDCLLLDDIEAGIDVDSEAEAKRLRKRLQEALALPPQQGTSTVIFIGTLKSQDCLSGELTDDAKNPAWRGQRYRALESMPVRSDMWEAFMGLLAPGERKGRPSEVADASKDTPSDEDVAAALEFPLDAFVKLREEHRAAYAFYVANQKAMDEGVKVLDADSLPVRRIFEERAVLGERYYRCELQNDPPPPEDRLLALQFEALQARKLASVHTRTVPAWAEAVLVTCDVGLRTIHYEVSAHSMTRECSVVIDCGMKGTGLGEDGRWEMAPDSSKAGLMERGIRAGLDGIYKATHAAYAKIDTGEVLHPYGAVDMGGSTGQRRQIEDGDSAWARVVIGWCAGHRGRWWAVRGAASWSEGIRKKAQDGNWCWNERGFVLMHTDYFKTRLYNALQTPELFEPSPKGVPLPAVGSRGFCDTIPDAYLRHMQSEERDQHGKWIQVAKQNHFWDTAYMSLALSDLIRRSVVAPPKPPKRNTRKSPKWGKPIRRKF